jgi:hypothetical protein
MLNPNQNYSVVGEYYDFWPKDHTPMFINVSDSMNKIIGYSLKKKQGSLSIMSNFMSPQRSTTQFIPIGPGQTWAGMELTTNGRLTILPVSTADGPGKPKYLKMVAVDLSRNRIVQVAKESFKDPAFSTIQFMRKVKGYDYFGVAASNNVAIFSYNQSSKDFALINIFKNIYRNLIFEICFRDDYMIPMSTDKNDPILVYEFGKGSYNSLLKKDKSNTTGQVGLALVKPVFQNQTVKRLDMPQMYGNKKVDISDDGRTLYFGGDGGLALLKRHSVHSDFKFVRKNDQIKYYGLRATPSGHVVVQHNGSNKLAVYNKSLGQEVEFPSERVDNYETELIKEPHFSGEGGQMIWFGGETSIFIVDLRTLARVKINDLIVKVSPKNPEPICAIADFRREKICITYEINDETVIVYHQTGSEPTPLLMNEIFPKFEEISCMDLHREKLYGFIGGWTSTVGYDGQPTSRAIISAFEFNKSLKLMNELQLTKQKCSIVSKIAVSQRHKDILYAATDGPLFVIGFLPALKKFEILKAITISNSSCKFFI